MQIDIRSNVAEVMRDVADIHKRHVPFATIYAATLTAREVRLAEIQSMRQVFDRPTPYVLNALAVKPATRSDPVASVEFREFAGKGTPAKRFLNPNIHGGPRGQKSHERHLAAFMGSTFLVPGKDVPVNSYGNVTAGTFTRILSQLKLSPDATQNASTSRRSRAKRKNDAFFKLKGRPIIMHRKGDTVTPALIGVRAPTYAKRFPFYEVAQATVAREFPRQFVIALERAIQTSNHRGRWS